MMKQQKFISGNEAVAEGVRLANPHVVAVYPITPQTVVVERLAEMVEEGSLKSEFLHVESEHSALSACMGASALGARTFTATSSQGLLYLVECLHYASGGRFPIVMMNANRSLALPWSIYGDHRDSLSQLDSGWIQIYVEDAQESLDMVLQAFALAEHKDVLTPVMLNLDGFVLTHTYELVQIPDPEDVSDWLPTFRTEYAMEFEHPKNMGFSSQPSDNTEFKFQQNKAVLDSIAVIQEVDASFAATFGRSYGGLVDAYRCEDAELVVVSLGSTTGTCRTVVDELRAEGWRVGVLKIRFMRPFPVDAVLEILGNVKGVAVIDRDISFGYEGIVFTNVNSALSRKHNNLLKLNFIAGLGGRDISRETVRSVFLKLQKGLEGEPVKTVEFLNLNVETDE
jgi:pyruvate ferredoxin oxidoreductase alpha subunit